MIKLTVPIYYTQEFKTKKPKTFLVGMNWYRNAHFHIKNQVKKDIGENIYNQLTEASKLDGTYQVTYKYFFKSPVSDMPNVTGMVSKFVNDCLQEKELVPNDNVKYLIKETHLVGKQDKQHPRVEVEVKLYKEENINE